MPEGNFSALFDINKVAEKLKYTFLYKEEIEVF